MNQLQSLFGLQPARTLGVGWLVIQLFLLTQGLGADAPEIAFLKDEEVVRVTGLQVAADPAAMLSVHVLPPGREAKADSDLPAVAGSHNHDAKAGTLQFRPKFGFDPGLRYVAKLRAPGVDVEPLVFSIAKEIREPSTVVDAVFPSADVLPENHLRFYIHFSAPMSRGFAYRNLRLLDSAGRSLVRPFLELDEELWDPDGKRLTLFLDPGRVKRGLKPREEGGPVLEAGKDYTLVVDEAFQDAHGVSLRSPHHKKFRAGPVDYAQPNHEKWKVAVPVKATRDALIISLQASLDRGMLERMIEVIAPGGAALDGAIAVKDNETVWEFTPEIPWIGGNHKLRIDRLIEDSCGNSIERQFEIARSERKVTAQEEQFAEISFRVAEAAVVSSNWGEWRGPLRSGVSSETGLPASWGPGERLVWQAKTAGPGASTPIVWDDRVFITAQTGQDTKIRRPGVVLARADADLQLWVQCFRRTDGSLLWEKSFDPQGTLTPTHTLHNQCTPSCVTDGERVIAWFATGQLFCFSNDGEILWQRNLAEDYGEFDLLWAHASSPTLFGDLVYVLCDHNPQAALIALDKSTGKERWKVSRGKGLRSYSTPLIYEPAGESAQIIVNSNPGIDAYSAQTGTLLWKFEEFCKVPVPVPGIDKGVLYASRGYSSGPFMALKIPSTSKTIPSLSKKDALWRMPSRAPYVSSPLVYNDRVYLSSETGQVFCLEKISGEILWSRKLGETFWSSPVAGEGKVYLHDESGEMVVLSDGPELSVLARNRIPFPENERALGSPAISHGCLFFRCNSRLFCVGAK